MAKPTVPKEKWAKFFNRYAKTFSIADACRVADLNRSTFYAYLKSNRWVRAQFEHARKGAVEKLHASAFARATEGVKEEIPIVWQGQIIGHRVRTRYSDALTIRLLEAFDPANFKRDQYILPKPDNASAKEYTEEELQAIIADAEARQAHEAGETDDEPNYDELHYDADDDALYSDDSEDEGWEDDD